MKGITTSNTNPTPFTPNECEGNSFATDSKPLTESRMTTNTDNAPTQGYALISATARSTIRSVVTNFTVGGTYEFTMTLFQGEYMRATQYSTTNIVGHVDKRELLARFEAVIQQGLAPTLFPNTSLETLESLLSSAVSKYTDENGDSRCGLHLGTTFCKEFSESLPADRDNLFFIQEALRKELHTELDRYINDMFKRNGHIDGAFKNSEHLSTLSETPSDYVILKTCIAAVGAVLTHAHTPHYMQGKERKEWDAMYHEITDSMKPL